MEEAEEANGNVVEDPPKLHPLMQPPVLKVLFDNLSRDDFPACRLACKTWYTESILHWRKNATVKFEGDGIGKQRMRSRQTTSIVQFLDFWENGMSECATKPYKQFHISRWKFKVGDVAQARFVSLVGQHVTSLTFTRCYLGSRDSVRRTIYQTFPNLQFLKMENCRFSSSGDSERTYSYYKKPIDEPLAYKEPSFGVHGLQSLHLARCLPVSMMEMLSHFHMLNSLHVEPGPINWELLNTIRIIRTQDQRKLPLKHLDLGDFHFNLDSQKQAEYREYFNLLQQLSLPLYRLIIYLDALSICHATVGNIIRDVLRTHSSTLEYFDGTGNLEGLCDQFPFGIQLDTLEEVGISPHFCENLSWLKYTPNLCGLFIRNKEGGDSLVLSNNLFYNSPDLEVGNWTLSALKSFRYHLPLCARNMRKLMKRMPNVEVLELELDDEKFALLCKHWKQLKKLADLGDMLTDEGVTGTRVDAVEVGAEEAQNASPNITQLQGLTHFLSDSSSLTARSVYDGFLKMSELKIVRCNSAQIDPRAVEALERKGVRVLYKS